MKKSLLILFIFTLVLSSIAFSEVSIVITEPQNNAVVAPNGTIMVKMEVTTTEGEEIQDVRLYNHGKTKRRLRREPWEFEWDNLQTGSYMLEAKVTLDDEDNTEIWSAPVFFRCGDVQKGERAFNGGFESGNLAPWTTTLHEGALATFNIYDDTYFDDPHYLFVEIENESSVNWHIQLNQNVPLDSGHVYDIYFYADADDKRPILVTMQENQDPWAVQFSQEMEIDGADEYMASFEAVTTDPTNNIRFNMGANKAAIFLDNIRIIDNNAASVKESRLGFAGTPVEFELFKAYPNPFNMHTTLQYRLSTQADVRLEIFNTNGQLVKQLLQQTQQAGHYTVRWNGTDMQNHIVPSGVYFYRLTFTADGHTSALHQKMMLVK